ncbi:hypothetical protein [Dinoroseobacter sp. S124A]|uniref:hypothetical protein n=1 Tax=Dinoroseobacter sp. S124A TaxID=3415128 RepID=UPI003C7E4AAC
MAVDSYYGDSPPEIKRNNCEHWRHVSDVLKSKVDAAIAARNSEVAETYHAMLIEHECRKPGA